MSGDCFVNFFQTSDILFLTSLLWQVVLYDRTEEYPKQMVEKFRG